MEILRILHMLSISKERFYVKIKSFSQIAAHKQTTNQLNKFFIARTALRTYFSKS